VNFAGTTADLVEDEGVGAAVEPGSAEALAAQLCAWADEPAAARSLGVRARELALARYDRKAIAQRLAEILDEAR
jgi:glycosyltransferase involved in cell wall biosynthesis